MIHNKILYNIIHEEIDNIKDEISEHKEIISSTKNDLEHIEFRILQAQNKYSHEYIPAMVSIRKFLLNRQKIHQEQLDRSLEQISELRKKILTS